MERAEMIRRILEIASILGEEVVAEVIEQREKTAPVLHTEAVSVETPNTITRE